MIKLIGVLIVIIGATFELNLLLTILVATFVTGWVADMESITILEIIGNTFTQHRFLSMILLVFPVVGLLERRGLYEKMENVFHRAKGAAVGSILWFYLTIREVSVAMGILFVGHPISRTLVAPMALEAAKREGDVLPSTMDLVKAMVIATENCGNFFGQSLFIASGSALFVRAVMEQAGYSVSILKIILYSCPIGLIAYGLVSVRCYFVASNLRREAEEIRKWRE